MSAACQLAATETLLRAQRGMPLAQSQETAWHPTGTPLALATYAPHALATVSRDSVTPHPTCTLPHMPHTPHPLTTVSRSSSLAAPGSEQNISSIQIVNCLPK